MASDLYAFGKENKSNLENRISEFVMSLKRRNSEGSFNVAKETAEILRLVISKHRVHTLQDILQSIREVGRRLISAQPTEFAIGNIVRRVLFITREEFAQLYREGATPSISLLSTSSLSLTDADYQTPIDSSRDVKNAILTSLTEMIDELTNLYRNISDQAIEHIHANEVIMTFGASRTVEEFLKVAARKRKFEVIVAEGAPSFRGRQLAATLSKIGIETILIPDSAIFAMMARVNKVVVSTHSVMANGGLIAWAGTHAVAISAKHHSVPFVVCTGLYKLCPLYPYSQDTINELKSPSATMNFEESSNFEEVHVHNPTYDYIPPELVTLYVTNFGGHNPSYIYRLLQEYYHPEDTLLEEKE